MSDPNAWLREVRRRIPEMDRILTNPKNVELVRGRVRPSRKHAPDVALKCGDYMTGYYLRFSVEDESVLVKYAAVLPLNEQPGPTGFAHVLEKVPPLLLPCPNCGLLIERSPLWLVESGLRALSDATRRPLIQIKP